jgi:CubicO group peptidase (beta-lactamase class C family)
MQSGQVAASGAAGYARMPQDTPDGQGVPFTVDTRCNLASVSKTLTATALFAMVDRGWVTSVNDPFWPLLANVMPGVTPAAGVETVTMGELLTMLSRLPEDGTLYTPGGESSTQFVENYLASEAILPSQRYVYSNTNFTILQEVIAAVAGEMDQGGYLNWVQSAVLARLGIDLDVFSPFPDDQATATLSYDPAATQGPGTYWPQMQCVGPGGWIGTATSVATYLAGVSSGAIMPQPLSAFMMGELFGWYHAGTGAGLAYHHNGGLTTSSGSGLSTGVVHFPDHCDAVLLTNTPYKGIIALMVDAYQSRA